MCYLGLPSWEVQFDIFDSVYSHQEPSQFRFLTDRRFVGHQPTWLSQVRASETTDKLQYLSSTLQAVTEGKRLVRTIELGSPFTICSSSNSQVASKIDKAYLPCTHLATFVLKVTRIEWQNSDPHDFRSQTSRLRAR